MDSKNNGSINIFHKLNPVDIFTNWNQNLNQNRPQKINYLKNWRQEEKRLASPDCFCTKRQESDTVVLGPGAEAGIGCGIGLGVGLVGGFGFSSGPWNQMRLVLGFGYGQGLGYGSSWKSIKSDVLGFKEKIKKKNSPKRFVADWYCRYR